jgi:esterase/lipase
MNFDIFMKCGYKSGLEESLGTFKASRGTHSISIAGLTLGGDASPIVASYTLQGKTLMIEGQRSGQPVEIVLHRLNWGPMLPFGS